DDLALGGIENDDRPVEQQVIVHDVVEAANQSLVVNEFGEQVPGRQHLHVRAVAEPIADFLLLLTFNVSSIGYLLPNKKIMEGFK
ncbi:MAG: hypothetical protein ABS920_03595, partial [Sporosarcina sp.]